MGSAHVRVDLTVVVLWARAAVSSIPALMWRSGVFDLRDVSRPMFRS